jgi:hypothetical protein
VFMFSVELFRQKAGDSILVLGGRGMETKDIKQMEKRFGRIDWVERRWHAVWANDSGIVQEVGACVSFFIASPSRDALALAAWMRRFWGEGREHDHDGRSIVGLARGSDVGGTAVDGGMGGCS